MQHMVRRLVCLATVAGLSFGAQAYEDEYVSTDGSPTVIDLGGDLVYVFSNKADVGVARAVTAQKAFTLKEALVVGGGGGGGAVLGGGGGGGQVLSLGTPTVIAASDELEVTVGAGGALDGWNGGKNGGHSKLVLPSDETHFAYGGGGGGGFSGNKGGRPAEVANEIGSGGGGQLGTASGSTKGTYYNYGNRGGSNQGGGGGAASPGENGGLHAETVLYGTETTYRKQAGYGGEGLTNFIVGIGEVYGSGGGGGGGQDFWSQKHAPGGTHAGAGATRSDKSGGGDGTRDALPADPGFGAGGGGGSFSATGGSGSNPASAGGCGTVILRIVKSAPTFFSVGPIADVTFDAPLALPKPAFVSNIVAGVALAEGADYTLSYDCGEPTELGADRRVTLTVFGKEGTAYAGYATTIAFTLKANRMTVAAIPDQLWQGADVCPVPTVTDPDRGTTLALGQDFTVDYADNGRPAESAVTATVIVSGVAGTRYAGVTVEVPYQVHAPVFTIAAIPGAMYLGSAVEPSVTVTRDFDGVALTRDVDFTVAYANNGGVGVATATVSGKSGTMYAGYSATGDFNILEPAYTDDYIMTSDPNPVKLNANGNIVYRFSDATAGEIAIGFRQQVTIERTLTVGGGGGGGGCVAGAGGGGGVIARTPVLLIPSGTAGALQVGAGGAGGAADGMKAGENGGHSKLILAGLDDHAYGGGGGGSYNYEPGKAAVTGEIGSGGGNGQKGGTTTADKTWYNSTQGNRGAMVTCGGGGGAGQAATGGPGGEGVTNDITGVEEVYGSGGGGGAGNGYNVNGSAGGTHGGCGAAQGSSEGGTDGDDGFGAGGGGGSYGANSRPVTPGGRGGSGVVLLAFQLGDRTQYRFEVLPIADRYYTMSAIEPEVVVSNPVSGVVLARGTDYDVAYSANVQVGTATVTVTGRDGTPYAGYVAVGRFRIIPQTFSIAAISSRIYVGQEIRPAVAVTRDHDGAALTEEVDFTVGYADNDSVGTATVTATGKAGTCYAGLSATQTFQILAAASEDELAAWSDASLAPLSVQGNTVYALTNVAAGEVVLQFKRDVTVMQSLVVGGGGGAGSLIGGGGGAGAVLASAEPFLIPANTPVLVRCGAGGAGGTKGGVGTNGDKSTLAFDAFSIVAFGGGGGGGWNSGVPQAAAVANEIASGGGSSNDKGIGTAGKQWNTNSVFGCAGAQGGWNNGGGGGGSRGNPSGATGGAGLVSAITGAEKTYGAGGAGGLRSAGAGAAAADNTGCGGQGGGYANNGQHPGGAGGSGLVALAVQPGDRVNYRFEILPIADQYYTTSAIEPEVVVSNPVSHVVLVRGTDYELAFENNTAVGTASVIAVGKEGTPYEGFRAGASFAIRAPTISIAAVEDAWFDGNEACPEPAVTRDFDGAALVKNVDFIYTYTNNSAVGTAIVVALGMDGTRYAGLSASTTFELKAQTFSIDPIPDQLYLGAAVAPEVTVVRDHDGDALSVWTDVEVFYADNDAVGTATVTASGRVNTAYAGLSATRTFNIVPAWYDDYVVTDDMSVRTTNVGGRLVYIFTNAAKTVQFKFRQNMTLKDALLVGGGGAGGCTVGGGGGGGGVVTLAVERVCFEGSTGLVSVGAGGAPTTSWDYAGCGSPSVFTLGTFEIKAFGGGGGGGYNTTKLPAGEYGSCGGSPNSAQMLDGYQYTSSQGNKGAIGGGYTAAGGGGGAGGAATSKDGGAALTNSITGVAEGYGGGGGGAARGGDGSGVGGTHAGNGGVTTGYPGDDGFGGGGGGGTYRNNVSGIGGRGGTGTVILSFAIGGEAGQPEFASAEIDFPYGTTQPRATVVLGGKPTASYSAAVQMMFGTDGETWLQTEEIPDVSNGKGAELLGNFSPASGSDIHLQVVVWAEGAQERVTNLVVRADNPQSPYYGKGGGAGVIHVRPGATGKNDGTDWFNACTDFREAIKQLSVGRDELWFAGDELVKVDPPSINPSVAATLRGGFGGLETSIDGRADGARSTISVEGPHTALSIANAEALTLEGFRTRGGSRGLSKSGAGALTVTNCVFEKVSSSSGEALGVVVKGTGVVRFANVRFSEFYQTETATQRNGAALFLNGPSRVYLDDCLFVSNGVPFSTGSGSNQAYAMRGSALYSSGTPLTARNCRFVGNRGQTLDVGGGEGGGVVRLDGACGGSAFSNCFFVANENIHGYSNYTQYPTDKGAGALTLILGAAGRTVDVVNCTFAYNLIEGREATAGLNVRSGTANVRNSIFFGQVRNPLTSVGRDILVNGATAAVNVDYTLFAEVSTNTCSTLNDGQLKLGKGIVTGDPLFVAPADEIDGFVSTGWYKFDHGKQTKLLNWANVHLRGGSGYVDEKTGETVKAYRRLGTSPAINAGDPKSDWSNEPKPNGRRVNMGAYGNTPWATMSPAGTALIVR